jgi:phosphoribosylformimino-5-aminoimidazole carboxamide ribotide isomerase
MKIIPAIDILEGAAVRLHKGRRDEATVYSRAPWALTRAFADAGAERIHLVDLDGAFSGERERGLIERVIASSPVPVELGGGLRHRAALEAAFSAGARWAVLGTAAIKDPTFVEEACREHPDRIIVAVDAQDGRVAVEGWTETSEVLATELAERAAAWGAAAILYTDVSRDGTSAGPNVAATAELHAAVGDRVAVIASGGVGELEHLRALAAAGIPYAVVGRALYDERFSLSEAIAAAAEAAC